MNDFFTPAVVMIILSVVAMMVIAASGSGNDKVKCLQTVTAAYPNDSVYLVPDKSYSFIVVKKNGEVLLVKTMNLSNTDITSTDPLVKVSVAASTEPTKVEK
jgi:hypothetical protein